MSETIDATGDPYEGALAFYIAMQPGELPDIEVAAPPAIQWAQGIKAAAAALDPSTQYSTRQKARCGPITGKSLGCKNYEAPICFGLDGAEGCLDQLQRLYA